MTEPTPLEIGDRVRRIRRRRGLSQETVAGLAGITRSYLSHLERGVRKFERRSLLEDLARALGCAVSDLTGQPYAPTNSKTTSALAAVPPISVALADATLNDVPDVPARAVTELVRLVRAANAASANSQYAIAGHDLADLLVELHVHVVSGSSGARRIALAGLVEACIVAVGMARNFGALDLANIAGNRAQAAAAELENPALSGFAAVSNAVVLGRLGARHRARRVTGAALDALDRADPGAEDTVPAEAAGMLHLASAQLAAKDHDADTAATHLAEAAALAERTGERHALHYDFGPANVRAWDLSLHVELGSGVQRAELITGDPGYEAGLISADRRAALHFDLARGFAQAEGGRDVEAVRHLDRADRIAPLRIRHDPIARELVNALDARAARRAWELSSLKARIHVG